MTTQNVHEELQFDYFSQNYYQFQEDFYQFSNLPQPLMVMEDDILRHMASRQVTYLKLSKYKILDKKDNYYNFKISRKYKTKRLCIYHYQGQTEDINY